MGRSSNWHWLAIAIALFLPFSAQVAGAQSRSEIEALNRRAQELYSKGQYADAAVFAERALALVEKTFGPEDPTVATALNNLGVVYRKLGRNREAEPLYLRALRIREKKLTPDNPTLADTLNNLSSLYIDERRYAEAEPLVRRVLPLLRGNDPDLGGAYFMLGVIREGLGYPAEARRHFLSALSIFEGAGETYGSFVASLRRKIATLPAEQEPAATLAPAGTGTFCRLATDAADRPAPGHITVTVRQPDGPLRAGEPVTVEWKVDAVGDASCRTPLYLVLTTPMRTRFEGDKFLALPAGPPGPFGIRYDSDRTRVFIPLHLGPSEQQGQLRIKTYQTGAFVLDWALVEVASLVPTPRVKQDIALGRERVTRTSALGRDLAVIGGSPAIVVRDQFSTDAPTKVIRSNSNEFDLQIFDAYYRVLDSRTGELLLERAGYDPNFSPSSRFIGAYAEGPGFEIVDLYSGQVVTSAAIMNRDRGFLGRVHAAAWSPGDAFFALSVWGWGGIEVQQALVDGSQRSFPSIGCHYCLGINASLRIDLEAAIVAYGDMEKGWESLLDRGTGTDAITRAATKELPKQSDEERRAQLIKQRVRAALEALGRIALFKADDFITADDAAGQSDPAANWRLAGPVRLSHSCLKNPRGACIGALVDWQAVLNSATDAEPRLRPLLVAHRELTASPTATATERTQIADARLVSVRGAAARTMQPGRTKRVSLLWARLAQLFAIVPNIPPLKAVSPGIEVKIVSDRDRNAAVAAAIIRSVPTAAAYLRSVNQTPYVDPSDVADDAYFGLKVEAKLVDPRTIFEHAAWSIKQRQYWLIHGLLDYGASTRHWLFLLYGTADGASHLIDLTHRLKDQVIAQPAAADGAAEVTTDWAQSMGFGAWPSEVDQVSVAYDRYLISSGTWSGVQRRWLMVFDLATDKILYFNREIPDGLGPLQFAVSEDGNTLVQANANGHLYFYDVPAGKLALRGVDIDDELVVFDPHGYYVATPEGAQFIFLKFPGLVGYNAFQQFANTLNRPDLVRVALARGGSTPVPVLTPPPAVTFRLELASTDANRVARLKVNATSTVGLKELQIFVDGRPVTALAVQGQSAAVDAAVTLSAEARWITVTAIDVAGYTSVPQGQSLAGAQPSASSRLFVVAVGTDTYDDIGIAQLHGAKADAGRFVSAVNTLGGSLYAKIEAASMLDSTELRTGLPARLRDIVAKASAADTIMLFVAGHGLRDTSGRFYLIVRDTNVVDIAHTALAWDDIASALAGAKARVIVFLDACQSGAAGGSNDDAVSSLLRQTAAITVIAAAKGRQESLESGNGGLFTTALVRAITTDKMGTDTNRNGAIELAELYAAVKRDVVAVTGGLQTPWIARNLMVGETPLF